MDFHISLRCIKMICNTSALILNGKEELPNLFQSMLKLQNIFFLFKVFLQYIFYFLRLEEIPGEDAEVFKQYTKEELDGSDVDQYKHELNLLEENLSAKRPDLKAIEEFKRKEAVYLEVRFNFYTNFVLFPTTELTRIGTQVNSALGRVNVTNDGTARFLRICQNQNLLTKFMLSLINH